MLYLLTALLTGATGEFGVHPVETPRRTTELLVLRDVTDAPHTATRDPARFLGVADSVGTIEPGKAADLVLLAANPLADIRNVRTVQGVVPRGSYLSAETLAGYRTAARQRVGALQDSLRTAAPPGHTRLALRAP